MDSYTVTLSSYFDTVSVSISSVIPQYTVNIFGSVEPDSYAVALSAVTNTVSVSVSSIAPEYTINIQEAEDGKTPLLSATETALEVSIDNGITWDELISYNELGSHLNISGDYLPLSGGTINGDLTITGSEIQPQGLIVTNGNISAENGLIKTSNPDGELILDAGGIVCNFRTLGGDARAIGLNFQNGETTNPSGIVDLQMPCSNGFLAVTENTQGIPDNINALSGSITTLDSYSINASSINTSSISTNSLNTASLVIGNGSASSPSISFTSDSNTGIYRFAADTLCFTTGGTAKMVINSTGNVGIGTTTPNEKLTVVGNISATGSATIQGSLSVTNSLRVGYSIGLNINNKSSGLTYSGGSLSSVNYDDGSKKEISYNPDGTLNILTITLPGNTVITKNFTWSNGVLTGITII